MKLIILILMILSCSKESNNLVNNETEKFSEKWAVFGTNIRLREEPNIKSKIISELNSGNIVFEIKRDSKTITIDDRKSFWLYVKTEKGEKGWIFGGFLSLYPDPDIAKLTKIGCDLSKKFPDIFLLKLKILF